MLLFIRIFLVFYGLIAAATGFMGTTAKYKPALTDPMTDNNHRYVAAIWMAMSLGFLRGLESFRNGFVSFPDGGGLYWWHRQVGSTRPLPRYAPYDIWHRHRIDPDGRIALVSHQIS